MSHCVRIEVLPGFGIVIESGLRERKKERTRQELMDGGQIVEQGNHAELLAAGGAYANLYNAQFAGAAVDLV